jgi:Glu-tRNA(Gln) amidotransferase subunit E-like FAD-binding protein
MPNNTRHLTNLAGHSACLCPMCWSTENARRFAKRRVRRAVRHSERGEIDRALHDEADRDGDAAYVIHVSKLSLDNIRNLRSYYMREVPKEW